MPRRKHQKNIEQPTEREVQDAVAVITRDYYADVASLGDDLIARIKEGEIEDPDNFHDALHDAVDGTQRVIYTWQARLGVLVSENWDAGLEEGIIELSGDTVPWEQLMFAAMERDVVEYMDREGVDPSDDASYESDEDED
jgi:hypothetical protein